MGRSPHRLHERRKFFKYMTADVAATVLKTHKLRWSSPLLFNDPFDVPRELSFGVTTKQLAQAVADQVVGLIENPPDDLAQLSPMLRAIVGAAKAKRSPELNAELIKSVRESAAELDPTEDSMDEFRTMWREQLPKFRILCFCARNDSASMWLHYADRYKGAVIELEASDERDSAWLMAKEVAYPDILPDLYSADGWARYVIMGSELSVPRILEDATSNKARDWSYEHEWRIASFMGRGDADKHSDYGFNPLDISGIYLGPHISDADKARLTALATRLPNAKVYETSILQSREFAFKQIAP